MRNPRCPLCNGALIYWTAWPGRDFERTWQLWRCVNDALVVPAADGGRPAYDSGFDQVEFHTHAYLNISDDDTLQQARDQCVLVEELEPWLGPKDGVIAEIGAGSGTLTSALKARGWTTRSSEPSNELVERAHRLFDLTEAEMCVADGWAHLESFGVARAHSIVMWHVLEHVSEAGALATKAFESLTSPGALVLQLPMLAPEAIFDGHYFLVLPPFPEALARRLGGHLAYVAADLDRLYLTVVITTTPPQEAIDTRPRWLPRTSTMDSMAFWLAASRISGFQSGDMRSPVDRSCILPS